MGNAFQEPKQPDSQGGRQSKNESIEAYLNRKYAFRFNTVKCKPEYKKIDSSLPFIHVTRFALNSFKRELDRDSGISTSAENIRAILESNFSTKVHPVQEYFKNLLRLNPKTNGYIEALAATVQVTNSEKWLSYFTKWLVGVVANALNDIGCQNHLCLVLTGEQGSFKTTWLDNICPKTLKSYLFTGKIDPQSKDVLTLIAEYLFINIDDQLKALNKRDENELKNLITTPAVKYRRPYDVYIEEYPHLASFMASVNGTDFLTDPTGSRRFLPFEVVKIDLEAAQNISMDKVFSEVLCIYESGFRYWFDDAEIVELHRHSSGFHVQTSEYEMLVQGFEKPSGNTVDCFMTTTQILNYLRAYCTLNLSEKRMGEALHKAGFERRSKRIGVHPIYVWLIQKVTPNPFISFNL